MPVALLHMSCVAGAYFPPISKEQMMKARLIDAPQVTMFAALQEQQCS